MTKTSSSLVRVWRRATGLVGLLVVGAVLSACGSSGKGATPTTTSPSGTSATTAPTSASSSGASSSNSKIEALTSSLQGAETATFKAVYTVTDAGMTQTVTLETGTSEIRLLDQGRQRDRYRHATYYCTDSGQAVCLSAGTANPLASLTNLFSPQTALNELKAAQAQEAANAQGYSITFSPGTYGGQSTTCADISGHGTTEKLCVTKQGIVALRSSGHRHLVAHELLVVPCGQRLRTPGRRHGGDDPGGYPTDRRNSRQRRPATPAPLRGR